VEKYKKQICTLQPVFEAIWKNEDGIGYFEERNEENKYSPYRTTNETQKCPIF
jgi:hypothetical protein